MTPERAAQILQVGVGAPPAEIEKAFARRARQTHPDLFAGESDAERAARAAAFADLTLARDTLVRRAAAIRAAAEAAGGFVVREVGPPPPGRWLLGAWIGLLVLSAFLSIYGAPHPFTVAEPLARWVVLSAALVGFGLTGRRPLLVLAVVAIIATVVLTVVFTSLGGLLGLLGLLVPVLGLVQAGLALERRRARGSAA